MPKTPKVGVCRQIYECAAACTPAPDVTLSMDRIKEAHELWIDQRRAMELVESALKRKSGVPPLDTIVRGLGHDWQTTVGQFPRMLAKYLGETIYPCVATICSNAPADSELRKYRHEAEARIEAIIADADKHLDIIERALDPDAPKSALNAALKKNWRLARDAIVFAVDFRAVADPGSVRIRRA